MNSVSRRLLLNNKPIFSPHKTPYSIDNVQLEVYHPRRPRQGHGKDNLERYKYNQVVRVGDTIHISGQGGWDYATGVIHEDTEKQIDEAFANIDHILREAGGKGWEQVFRVNSYHIPLDGQALAAMTRNFDKWMPNHKSLWTCIGVVKLGAPDMRVEIEVQAYDPEGASKA